MKFQNKVFILFTCIAFLSVLSSCKTNEVNTAILNGMIYDADNKPVANAKVSVWGSETTTTDVYGHFTFSDLLPDEKYEIHLSKTGYEPQVVNFTFNTISSVMYIRMYSINQLLSLAEDSIKKMDYDTAKQYLDRAETINSNKASISFLRAVIQYRLKKYGDAEQTLLTLLEEGYTEQSVYLFLADLYENELTDITKAEEALKQALSINYDPNIESRLNQLYD